MSEAEREKAQSAAEGIVEMAEEFEASGESAVDITAVQQARATLHAWVDTVTGVVVTHAFGRVTLIHENGRHSSITSPELPFAMSKPAAWKPGE